MSKMMKTQTNQKRFYGFLKRLLDVLVSGAGLLFLAPFFLWIRRRIRRDSPGPVFYRGRRIGRGGKEFSILKFRTMYERTDSFNGPLITAQDDPRVTPFGRWLRDTKLNELPQLWNVFKGEMSLVGPRPEDPEIAAGWDPQVRAEVLSVRPGITSPASVLYRDEEQRLGSRRLMETYLKDILPSKLRLDQLYVRHRSFFGDLDVIFWTFLLLAPRINLVSPPESLLFLGPLSRLMRRYISWFFIDLLITLLAMGLSGLLWRSFGPLDVGLLRAVGIALGFGVLFSLSGAVWGAARISWSKAAPEAIASLLPGVFFGVVQALVLNHLVHRVQGTGSDLQRSIYWSPTPLLPTALILTGALIALVGFIIARYRMRLVTGLASRWLNLRGRAAIGQEKVLFIGGGETAQFNAWRLSRGHFARSFHIVGCVDDDLYKQGIRISGLDVLGLRGDIPALVKKHDVGLIIFAIHNIQPAERREILELCAQTPARTVVFPDLPAALNMLIAPNGNGHGVRETQPLPQKGGLLRWMGRLLTGRDGTDIPSQRDDSSPRDALRIHASTEIPTRPAPSRRLPCHLCLWKVSPMIVDEWLAELEYTAEKGDLAAVQARLANLRQQLQSDVSAQKQANQEE